MTIKFALVGCGRISARHAELLGGGKISNAMLVGVCDVITERAERLGTRYGVPFFADMHQMVDFTQPDVVVVLTESGNHAEHVLDLVRHGKHILVEKPMSLRLCDADKMIRACKTAGVKLFVVKQNRFNVPVVKLREALDKGRFGKIVLGTVRVRWCRPQEYYSQAGWRGTWAFDGGVLSNQASHHVDLLTWMLGPVDSVFAFGRTALAKIEAEDTAVVVLKFISGALGVIEATTATRPTDLEGSISILGEGGTVEIGGFAVNEMRVWSFVEPNSDDPDIIENYSVNPPDVYGFGHHAYYEHVVRCLRDGGANYVDGYEGRRSVELINAIYQSIETNEPVCLRGNVASHKLGFRNERSLASQFFSA